MSNWPWPWYSHPIMHSTLSDSEGPNSCTVGHVLMRLFPHRTMGPKTYTRDEDQPRKSVCARGACCAAVRVRC